jgi:hypothetical protein
MRYDPSKYEDVATRLQRIYALNPKLRIITEIEWHDVEFNKVCFKASLLEDDTVIATGFAMDWKSKDRGATTTNWVETSETSAIGRCIANSKYQDKNAERPSKQEMEIASERSSATPVKAKAATKVKPTPSTIIAEKQPVLEGKALRDKTLKELVGAKEKDVNNFLIGKAQIKKTETFLDVSDAYAKQMIDHPAKFLAIVTATCAKS